MAQGPGLGQWGVAVAQGTGYPLGAAAPSFFFLNAFLAAFTSPVGKSRVNIYPVKYLKNAGGPVFMRTLSVFERELLLH